MALSDDLALSSVYLWFEAFPIVFTQTYGFNPGESGLAFMGILVSAFSEWPRLFLQHSRC